MLYYRCNELFGDTVITSDLRRASGLANTDHHRVCSNSLLKALFCAHFSLSPTPATPRFLPFQGIAYLDVSKKNAFILSRNYSVFLRISSVLAQFQGVWGRFWGRGWDEKGRRFCRRIPLLGEILGGWGGRKPGDFFSKNTSKLGNFLGG